jgi:serine/threonine protein kinase
VNISDCHALTLFVLLILCYLCYSVVRLQEVIRHESYSSNADVYSFGVFLWQLITRQVPFASMTPVQAAYAVAEGRRPDIPASTPARLREIIQACWHQDSHQRPSFTYIAMALADYAKLSFSSASVGAHTLQIANEMLATVEGNSNINVDFTTPVPDPCYLNYDSDVGLEI